MTLEEQRHTLWSKWRMLEADLDLLRTQLEDLKSPVQNPRRFVNGEISQFHDRYCRFHQRVFDLLHAARKTYDETAGYMMGWR